MTIDNKEFVAKLIAELKDLPPSNPQLPHFSASLSNKQGAFADPLSKLLLEISEPESSGGILPALEEKALHHFPAPASDLIKSAARAKRVVSELSVPAVGLAMVTEDSDGLIDPHLRYLLLSPSDTQTIVFDMNSIGSTDFLAEILFNPKVCKVFFDAKPFLRSVYKAGMAYDIPNITDLLLLNKLLHCGESGLSHTLSDLVMRELNYTLPSVLTATFSPELQSAILLPLAKSLWPKIRAARLHEVTMLELETVKAVALMELNGAYFNPVQLVGRHESDSKAKDAVAMELKAILSEERTSIFGAIPKGLNLESPAQVRSGLKRLGIDVPNTSENFLLPLADKYPVVAKLLKYRKLQHSTSSITGSLLKHVSPVDGRIHSTFGQCETDTGRLNSSSPNLHNIKKGPSRELLQAEDGNMLVIADFKQIELVIAAVIASDPVMLQEIQDGIDLHTQQVATLTKKRPEEITSEERQKGKAINFGLVFLMSSQGLVRYAKSQFGVSMTLEEAELARKLYFEKYKGINAWHKQQIKLSKQLLEARTLSDRRRLFKTYRLAVDALENREDLRNTLEGLGLAVREVGDKFVFTLPESRTAEVTEVLSGVGAKFEMAPETPKGTEVVNTPVQGTGADIIKLAMVYATRRFLQYGSGKLILSNQDELIVEAPEDNIEAAAQILKDAMEDAGEHFLKVIRPPVTVKIGRSWAIKN